MTWRRAIVAIHRDVGYFFAALTVVYAISGVAVNHVGDWNPSYSFTTAQYELGALTAESTDELAAEVLQRLEVTETPRSAVRVGPGMVKIFLDNRTLTVGVPGGAVADEQVRRRPGMFEVNFLHLNKGKGWWTWFADLYAVGMAALALTGIFILKGRRGLARRGKWLVAAGIVIPAVYLLLL
jgi:hypothetical protein